MAPFPWFIYRNFGYDDFNIPFGVPPFGGGDLIENYMYLQNPMRRHNWHHVNFGDYEEACNQMKSVVFYGIPEHEYRNFDYLMHILYSLITVHLRVEDFQFDDITDLQRLGIRTNTDPGPRPLMVRFAKVSVRFRVIYRSLYLDRTPYSVEKYHNATDYRMVKIMREIKNRLRTAGIHSYQFGTILILGKKHYTLADIRNDETLAMYAPPVQ